MTVKRNVNVEGLRQNAQKKRLEALKKVEEGIQQLLKSGKPVNFNTVTQAANVSKAFLYKDAGIKERIKHIRQQVIKTPEFKQNGSDSSKDCIIAALENRIKDLEEKNKDLNHQNEVFAGQVIRVRELEQQIKQLEAENATLRGSSVKVSSSDKPVETTLEMEVKLKELGLELNSTIRQLLIRRLLRDAPQASTNSQESSTEELLTRVHILVRKKISAICVKTLK